MRPLVPEIARRLAVDGLADASSQGIVPVFDIPTVRRAGTRQLALGVICQHGFAAVLHDLGDTAAGIVFVGAAAGAPQTVPSTIGSLKAFARERQVLVGVVLVTFVVFSRIAASLQNGFQLRVSIEEAAALAVLRSDEASLDVVLIFP